MSLLFHPSISEATAFSPFPACAPPSNNVCFWKSTQGAPTHMENLYLYILLPLQSQSERVRNPISAVRPNEWMLSRVLLNIFTFLGEIRSEAAPWVTSQWNRCCAREFRLRVQFRQPALAAATWLKLELVAEATCHFSKRKTCHNVRRLFLGKFSAARKQWLGSGTTFFGAWNRYQEGTGRLDTRIIIWPFLTGVSVIFF